MNYKEVRILAILGGFITGLFILFGGNGQAITAALIFYFGSLLTSKH